MGAWMATKRGLMTYNSHPRGPALVPLPVSGTRHSRGRDEQANLKSACIMMPEEYACLHAEIERAARPPECFVVGVTSAVYGEGKTTVAMNLAGTIAQNSTQRVALVDTNLRTRDLQVRLKLAPRAGLVDVLEGEEDDISSVIHRTELENLTVVPAGRAAGNPARLSRSPRLGEAMQMLRRTNSYVVLDMSPVLPIADTRVLARMVDGFIVVVRAGVTPREVVARAIDTVGSDLVLGIVLNEAKSAMPEWLRRFFGGSVVDV